jgi:hypothetical protein
LRHVFSLSGGTESRAARSISLTVIPASGPEQPLSERAATHIAGKLSGHNSLSVKAADPGGVPGVSLGLSLPPLRVKSSDSPATTVPLTIDRSIEQSFTSEEHGLSGIQLVFYSPEEVPDSLYYFHLKDTVSGTILREAPVPALLSGADTAVLIRFNPLLNSKSRTYSFTITSAGMETEGVPSLVLVENKSGQDSSLLLDGKESRWKTDFFPLYSRVYLSGSANGAEDGLEEIAGKSGSDYILLCSVEKEADTSSLEARIYSASAKQLIYEDREYFSGEGEIEQKSDLIAMRVSAALSGGAPAISSVEPTRWESADAVFLTWKPVMDRYSFRVYRSKRERGPYAQIGLSETTSYIDHDAEPGLLYWYRVQPFSETASGELSKPAPGYRRLQIKNGENLDQIIEGKNRGIPPVNDYAQRMTIQKELGFLEEYFLNSFKVSFMMMSLKSYLDRGEVMIFRDPDNYSIDYRNSQVFLVKNNLCLIRFYSKKLFRLRDGSMPLHNIISDIGFGAGAGADSFSPTGFDAPAADFRWNRDAEASITVPVEAAGAGLYVDMLLAPLDTGNGYPHEKMNVTAGGRLIGSLAVTKRGKYRVTVSPDLLKNGTLKLVFSFPGARLRSGSKHSVAFSSIQISRKVLPVDLFTRLMQNALYYCVYDQDRPITQRDGTIRYLPAFQAIGMSTEYYRDSRNWKSNTIMISTSDEKLMSEMKKSRK